MTLSRLQFELLGHLHVLSIEEGRNYISVDRLRERSSAIFNTTVRDALNSLKDNQYVEMGGVFGVEYRLAETPASQRLRTSNQELIDFAAKRERELNEARDLSRKLQDQLKLAERIIACFEYHSGDNEDCHSCGYNNGPISNYDIYYLTAEDRAKFNADPKAYWDEAKAEREKIAACTDGLRAEKSTEAKSKSSSPSPKPKRRGQVKAAGPRSSPPTSPRGSAAKNSRSRKIKPPA